MKIMIYADSYSVTSGYAKVCRNLADRLVKKGHTVIVQEIMVNSAAMIINGVILLPSFSQRGTKLHVNNIASNLNIFKPDVFIPIGDPFLMESDLLHEIDYNKTKLVPYAMLDNIKLSDDGRSVLDKSDLILTGSECSKKALSEYNYESKVLYHGVDNSIYKPISTDKKKQFRKQFNIPKDKKMFLFVGRNVFRKQPLRLLDSIKKYNQQHENNNSIFVIHSSSIDTRGWNLKKYVKRIGKEENIDMSNIIFTQDHKLGEGMSEKYFKKLFLCSDYYITASCGEGFGLPIAEAMMSEIPVIAPDNTTHTEFLKDGRGILVKNESVIHVGQGLSAPIVDTTDMANKIHYLTTLTNNQKDSIIKKAKEFANNNFNWDKITIDLIKYIEEI